LVLFIGWAVTFGRNTVRTLHLLIAGACAVMGTVFNPYGVELVSFVANDVLVERRITEWDPIPVLDGSFLDFKVAVLAAFFIAAKKSSRRWQSWLLVVTAILALRHQRHTPFFAIAASPFLAAALESGLLWLKSRIPYPFAAPVQIVSMVLLGLLTMGQLLWMGNLHVRHRLQLVVNTDDFPVQAAAFLQENDIRGNLAAPFGWGEYLIWKLYPTVRVAIDGRYTTAYPVTVVDDSWSWMEGTKDWKRLLDAYPSDLAMTHRGHPVTALLRHEPEWIYIYSDPIAFIFVRNVPAQKELLDKFRNKQLVRPWPPPPYFPG
jgi:hypothetical protein